MVCDKCVSCTPFAAGARRIGCRHHDVTVSVLTAVFPFLDSLCRGVLLLECQNNSFAAQSLGMLGWLLVRSTVALPDCSDANEYFAVELNREREPRVCRGEAS